MGTLDIANHSIGNENRCFIIAEAGVNHNGDIHLAHRLIDAAVDAKADAVKFQTFRADTLTVHDAPKAEYQKLQTDVNESQYDLLKRLELSPSTHRELMAHCDECGIVFLSTPFDETSADFLDELEIAAFKIASGELTNLPFLAHVARKRKPMIVSTGMATLAEVELVLQTIYATGNRAVILLHCVSNYPANPMDVNLRAMQTMAMSFGVPIGYSDHTLGIQVALAAVALGACVIEKHFTLDRNLPGPDHQASLEPNELTAMVRDIRIVESALGHGCKEPAASEANTAAVARKSLVAASDIPAGTVLTEEMIGIKRPGTGLPPAMRERLIGRTTRVAIPAGTLITLEMLA